LRITGKKLRTSLLSTFTNPENVNSFWEDVIRRKKVLFPNSPAMNEQVHNLSGNNAGRHLCPADISPLYGDTYNEMKFKIMSGNYCKIQKLPIHHISINRIERI
jgi:hypothetical protein